MDQSQFKTQYARMADHQLIQAALRTELLPEARAALNEELDRRGITDIDGYRTEVEINHVALDNQYQARVDKSLKVRWWQSRALAAFGLVVIGFGIYLLVSGATQHDRTDGELLIASGVVLIPFAFISAWLMHVLRVKVLYRR